MRCNSTGQQQFQKGMNQKNQHKETYNGKQAHRINGEWSEESEKEKEIKNTQKQTQADM